MRMRFHELADSVLARRVGLAFCDRAPSWLGHLVARAMASVLIRTTPELHQAMEDNLRHVLGPLTPDADITTMARQSVAHFTRTSFDFFSTAGKGPNAALGAVRVPNGGVAHIKHALTAGQGVLALFPHISNFDLAGIALAATGLPLHVLSLANPGVVLREQNRLRELGGMRVAPISPRSLRDAIRTLRRGGIVFSGMDRPVPRERGLVEFFGQPSYLPLGPARMSLISGAEVFVASCRYEDDVGYSVDIVGPLELERRGRRGPDVMANARRLAVALEALVRARPAQWLMFHRLWPEARP